ncbi:LAMI_0D05050g1_1 [Lachancea mirantina]|uniref:Transmembrane 9 superfamily member n=1 Tax=Lachancea mirantina TaxID=1230905 RepID=A0A1G4JAW4_9SACH|nr:LAMI_0D05050g1_1 [Lachancea mirantina]
MRRRSKTFVTVVIAVTVYLLWLCSSGSRSAQFASNLGWIRPHYYKLGDPVQIIVNKVESDVTHFPYSYHDLPFVCPPSAGKKPLHLSLSEVIRGDRKWESDYKLEFGKDEPCTRLCDRRTQPDGLIRADEMIQQGYVAHWLIDDELPAATTFISTKDEKKYYASGFPLGHTDLTTGKSYINNHVMLVIRFHSVDVNKHTIVGFEVYPKSVSDARCPGASKNFEHFEIDTAAKEPILIPFTYSIYWREEFKVDWANRWNFFMNSGELENSKSTQFHWISLANSFIVVGVMTSIVALLVTSSRQEETVSSAARSLSVQSTPLLIHLNLACSVGVHFMFSMLGSLIVSCSLSKLHNVRNSVISVSLLFFVVGAYAASFVGSLLSPLSETSLGMSVVFGSTLPAITLCILLILNCVIWAKDSPNALPFGTIILFIAAYFVLCIPLSVLGGLGARRAKQSVQKGTVQDESKSQRFFLYRIKYENAWNGSGATRTLVPARKETGSVILRNPLFLSLAAGAPPFAVIYVELLFVYKSLWLEKTSFYYLYGFLLANLTLLCIIVSEVSVIICYLTILHKPQVDLEVTKRQDANYPHRLALSWRDCFTPFGVWRMSKSFFVTMNYEFNIAFARWRWKAFFAGGSVAFYFMLYSLYYLAFVLHLRDFSSILLFVCYTLLFNALCWCGFGCLGYLSCCWFLDSIFQYAKEQ